MNDDPTAEAGKTLTAVAPAVHIATISVGVMAPGKTGRPAATAQRTMAASPCGETMNAAPAAAADPAASNPDRARADARGVPSKRRDDSMRAGRR